jgi:hypothetical protein
VVSVAPRAALQKHYLQVLAEGLHADSFLRLEVDSAEALGLRCLRIAADGE